MKRIIISAALSFCILVSAAAANPIEKRLGGRSRAIGIRGAYGIELSYQHSLGANFVEADLGLVSNAFNLAVTYNWIIAQPQWADRGEICIYGGPGGAIGLGLNPSKINIAAAGQLGIEYSFWFPLQLSLDIRPMLGLQIGGGSGLYFDGCIPSFGIRYRF